MDKAEQGRIIEAAAPGHGAGNGEAAPGRSGSGKEGAIIISCGFRAREPPRRSVLILAARLLLPACMPCSGGCSTARGWRAAEATGRITDARTHPRRPMGRLLAARWPAGRSRVGGEVTEDMRAGCEAGMRGTRAAADAGWTDQPPVTQQQRRPTACRGRVVRSVPQRNQRSGGCDVHRSPRRRSPRAAAAARPQRAWPASGTWICAWWTTWRGERRGRCCRAARRRSVRPFRPPADGAEAAA